MLSGPDEPRDRRGRLFPGGGFDPVTAEYRRRAEKPAALPLPGHAVRPRESAGSFDHRYDAAAPADIPSDGTWHTVTVGEIAVGLRTEYVCVPAVEQAVYATLVLSNATDQALLAGPVEVSVDGEYQLTAALPTLAPGGVRRLGLGPAEAVGVTRRTHLTESTAGLRNNVTVLDHRVHVELANRLPSAVRVEVRERVPVTSEADVRIEERADWTEPEDSAARERHAPGTRIWRVDLPAGRHRRPRRRLRDQDPGRQGPDRRQPQELTQPCLRHRRRSPPPRSPPVTAVTCTEDRAHVERTATLELRPGTQRMRLGPVGATAVDRTLHAELIAGFPARVLDVRIVRVWTPRGPGPADDDSPLRRRVTSLEEERLVLEQRRDRLRARGDALGGSPPICCGRSVRAPGSVRPNGTGGPGSWTGWTRSASGRPSGCARWRPG